VDDVENDLKKIGVRGWDLKKTVRDRNAWRLILHEVRFSVDRRVAGKREGVGTV